MWVPAKRESRRNAKEAAKVPASARGRRNSFAPIAEDDDMEVGDVEEEEMDAVFVRQEC